MVRIIDADLLYDQVEARYRQSSGEEHRTEKLLLDAICDSPTIDAIPVEWLENYDSEGNEYGRRYITVVEALSMWQQEQEAR